MKHSNEDTGTCTRDKLLRALENSQELVRDFKNYSAQIKDDPQIADLFAEFSLDEGLHAAKIKEFLDK